MVGKQIMFCSIWIPIPLRWSEAYILFYSKKILLKATTNKTLYGEKKKNCFDPEEAPIRAAI